MNMTKLGKYIPSMKIVLNLETFMAITLIISNVFGTMYEINYRIVGGIKAAKDQFPWQVGIHLVKDTSNDFCGGALISPVWVLTAAHCITDLISATTTVSTTRISSLLNLLHLSFLEPGKRYKVVEFIAHEGYKKRHLVNDIALLKIEEPVDRLLLLSLPDQNFIGPNTPISISGWGITGDGEMRSTDLMYINMLTSSTKECQAFYSGTIDDDTTFCAIGEDVDNICEGDSGGPAVYYRDGMPIHVGILSFFHTSGCENNIPAGFTRTAFFRDWIRNISGI